MQIILQEKVIGLGNVGDQVNVKPGYARNYLFPKSMAILATAKNIELFEQKRAQLEKKAAEVLAAAKARAEKLASLTLTIHAQASDEGKLYGSIGPRDIAQAANEQSIELAKSEVLMPEGPIRITGEYTISLQLYDEVGCDIIVNVVTSKES